MENDEIFLLSTEEYERYKANIPYINYWWWLRSPGYRSNYAANVNDEGLVYHIGYNVNFNDGSVRPALKISNQESENLQIGDRLVKYAFPWIKIGDNLAIAEVPVGTHEFDKKSNDYEKSEIRQWLLNWRENR